jgi:hypothetical protein
MQEGDELTISYIDVGLPLSARRDELRKNFFFVCSCERCVCNPRTARMVL